MNPAEYVMNCPDLRNLILSHRTQLMRPYEHEYIKRKMAPTLSAIKNQVVSNNNRTTWCKIDSDGDYYFTCYCYKNGIPVIWYRDMRNPWMLTDDNLYRVRDF